MDKGNAQKIFLLFCVTGCVVFERRVCLCVGLNEKMIEICNVASYLIA